MASYDEITQPHIATIESDGRRYNVSVRVGYDGVEYVGRLWFADESWDDLGLPDRGALPGRTKEEVMVLARRLTVDEMVKIRYLNQVAISMRAGLLDVEGAAQEIDLTEKQLHALIDRLSGFAGVED
jgi:hypothetical protein